MYKGKKQVEKYMWYRYQKLVLFLQGGIFFLYVPENDIKEGILGWSTSSSQLMNNL